MGWAGNTATDITSAQETAASERGWLATARVTVLVQYHFQGFYKV